ncbi:MAG: phytanoyl-CoA dioxygenase family protein [Rhodospirillales bacterium]|nr:phytanoyl-CoA dioxygenase family protein [Rhodospirillales bacterium]
MARLNTFDAGVAADPLVTAIERDGYAIVRGILDSGTVARLSCELAPHLEATETGDPDAFFGSRTKRFGALLSRCPSARDMVVHPLVLAVADRVLGPYCARYQINYTGIMHIEPGESAQTMHRDTGLYPIQNPAPPLTLATMWAVTDFTAENGATRIVPGSHRWPDARVPDSDEIRAAEMPAGSLMLYVGNIIHGGGANSSNAARCGLALHYSLGWLRQEENQYLAVPMEEARTFTRQLQCLMGYDLGSVNLGFVDHKHPNDVLNGTSGEGPGELGPQALMDADNAIRRFKVDGTEAVGRTRMKV